METFAVPSWMGSWDRKRALGESEKDLEELQPSVPIIMPIPVPYISHMRHITYDHRTVVHETHDEKPDGGWESLR